MISVEWQSADGQRCTACGKPIKDGHVAQVDCNAGGACLPLF